MLSIITIINSIFQVYVQSLKRDIAKGVFETIALIATLSWIGLLLAGGLAVLGRFHMPTDPMFYLFWFGLTFSTVITFTAFLLGMLSTTFFAANSFGNVSFVITALYAVVFFNESYLPAQVAAIVIATVGATLFFEKGFTKEYFQKNKGILLVLFSLLLGPLEYVLYKSATLRTGTYDQFLTGRLVMDAVFYTLFFVVVAIFWYRKNPTPVVKSIAFSYAGLAFIIGSTLTELLESWLIFKMPVGLFVVLGTISIPAAYMIGKIKYKESITPRYVWGSLLIITAVVVFSVTNGNI